MTTNVPTGKSTKPARTKPSWAWQVFFFIFFLTTISNTVLFFKPDSPVQTYYKILIGFNDSSVLLFLLNALAVIFNFLAIVPFLGFVENKRFLTPRTWQWCYVLRLAFLLTGQSYALKDIQSLYHQDHRIALSVLISALIIHAPSYIATFLYAFRARR